ncbi:hypothetical protein [uncultured Sphingomonas sp.]|uniref:hypothetical protein n=1 Tax=uncultured Sphingomonas sp. TaxID=158754 RepID=UPI00258D499F|nr:hypothetical protein [uncultured Sphingomonas sp.]
MFAVMSCYRLFAPLPLLVLIGGAPAPRTDSVVLLHPYEQVTVGNDVPARFLIESLVGIDPLQPLGDGSNGQTLSLFGREDLIAASSRDFLPQRCRASDDTRDVMDAILQHARRTSVVIVNESHERSEHRGFITDLVARLPPEGYRALAIETLANPASDVAEKYWPSFLREPGLAYFVEVDGFYLREAGFGRLGRTAKRLGYALIPYEAQHDSKTATLSLDQQIAVREEAQANALAAWITAHPGTKLIVHVGYSHAREVATAKGSLWMAARLRAKTGIDPLTISQTTCRGSGTVRRLSMLPTSEPAGSFDLVVDHPTARFVRGRPAWRIAAGDRAVSIPVELRPRQGWRVIEARPDGEPSSSVPMDRVAIRPGEDVALLLPPGRYRLRALTPSLPQVKTPE